jgi:hypothetical protein
MKRTYQVIILHAHKEGPATCYHCWTCLRGGFTAMRKEAA